MVATAVEQEVLTLEKKYWDAMQKRDIPTMQSLTADPCVVVGAQGASEIPKSQFAQMMQQDEARVQSYRLEESKATVRQISDDVAVVAYRVHEDLERAGKREKLESYDTSIWVRKGGKWQCAVHTETRALN